MPALESRWTRCSSRSMSNDIVVKSSHLRQLEERLSSVCPNTEFQLADEGMTLVWGISNPSPGTTSRTGIRLTLRWKSQNISQPKQEYLEMHKGDFRFATWRYLWVGRRQTGECPYWRIHQAYMQRRFGDLLFEKWVKRPERAKALYWRLHPMETKKVVESCQAEAAVFGSDYQPNSPDEYKTHT